MSEVKNIPRLRFSEFDSNWEQEKIKNITTVKAGGTPSTVKKEFWGGKIPWMNSGELNLKRVYDVENRITDLGLKKSSTRLIPEKCILIGLAGQGKTRGTAAVNYISLCTNQSIAAIYPNHTFNTEFLYQNIDNRYDELRRLSTGDGGRGGLNLSIIGGFKVPIPSLPEQQKIADFLTSVDKRIELLEKKKTLLETFKKGVMKKIFNQEIRFREDNYTEFPDWKKFKLNQVLFEHKERNTESKFDEVFSVSKHKGVINQIEHLGRSYSAETIDHYKLINNWDVVYTKSPTSDFPFGIIKQNTTGRTGVLSPLYGVFKPKNKWIGKMIASYFESWVNTYNYLVPLVQKGAKNTMNINNDTFLDGKQMSLPTSENEQEKISKFLLSIENQIELLETQIDKSKTWKKGLLQKMFV